MSRYKVLPLITILDTKDEEDFGFFNKEWLDRKEKTEPIFNRSGTYLDRKRNIFWVETKFGCWILGDKYDFQHELEYQTSDEYILPKKVIAAFRILETYKLLSKELHMKWYQHTNATMLRDTRRSVREWVKELKEEEK